MSSDIQWREEYRIDNAEIDSQHKWLLEQAETLLKFDQIAPSTEELSSIVLQLFQYMEKHFDKEERLAKLIGDPKYDAHVKAHQLIIAKMNAMMTSCKTFEDLRPTLHEIFSNWVQRHIPSMDRDLALFIKSKHSIE
jgi:hemerythrin-like metal-binding protein